MYTEYKFSKKKKLELFPIHKTPKHKITTFYINFHFFLQKKPTEENGVPCNRRQPVIRLVGMAKIWTKTHQRLSISKVNK